MSAFHDKEHIAPAEITVVIVDVEPAIRAVLRDQLSVGMPEVIVIDEGDCGDAVIDLVAIEQPHVLIVDLELPGFFPSEALRGLKAVSPDTRVIILTAGDDGDRDAVLAAGADAYLCKPASLELLVDTVHAILERPTA